MESCEEITLRNLYLHLKRRLRMIAVISLGLALSAYVLSVILPKTYESTAIFAVDSSSVSESTAIVRAFIAQLKTREFADKLGEKNRVTWVNVFFDEKRGYLQLSAKAHDSLLAYKRAKNLAAFADESFLAMQLLTLRRSLNGERADMESSLQALSKQKQVLEESISSLSREPSAPRALKVLQSAGVDPLIAESPDPAMAYLRLELAKVEAEMAFKSGRIKQVESLLADDALLKKLAVSKLPIKLVSSPGLPLEPIAPKPLSITIKAFVLGLFLAVFWAFLQAALEPPEETQVAEKPSAVSG